MHQNNPLGIRNQNSFYVPYFYEAGIVQQYLMGKSSPLEKLGREGPAKYDFSSDLMVKSPFNKTETVEDIISRGYFAVPQYDTIQALLSDKKHTSRLGLSDIIGQIRNRYALYEKNIYDLEWAKCAAINTLYAHEAWHGPPDSRAEYSVGKRLDKLYKDQREERTNLWRDISRLKLLLPETAQLYLAAYRKTSILEDLKSDVP